MVCCAAIVAGVLLAVIADIHGNLPALEAVLADIDRQKPDHIVAAGDLALRGPFPKECVELIRARCHSVIIGNTDAYLAGNYLQKSYQEPQHWKTHLLEWSRAELGEETLAWMRGLPFSLRFSPAPSQDLFVCHANPRNLEDTLDPTLDDDAIRKYFVHPHPAAIAFGHLHFPYRRRVDRTLLVDVASVGIPRDGDRRACWTLFSGTSRGWHAHFRRVRYSVYAVTQALTTRDVPGAPIFAQKLREARYRNHEALATAVRNLPHFQTH